MRRLAAAISWEGPCPGWSNASPDRVFRVVVVEDDDTGDESCVSPDERQERDRAVSPGARRNLIAAGVLRR